MSIHAILVSVLGTSFVFEIATKTVATIIGGLFLLLIGQSLVSWWRFHQVVRQLQFQHGAHLGGGDIWRPWWGIVIRNKTEYEVNLYAVKAKVAGESQLRCMALMFSPFDKVLQKDGITSLQAHIGETTYALENVVTIKGVDEIVITYGVKTLLGGIRQKQIKVGQKIVDILNQKAIPAYNKRLIDRLQYAATKELLRPYLVGENGAPLRLLVRPPGDSSREYRAPTEQELQRVIDWFGSPTDFTTDNVRQWEGIALNLNPRWLVSHALGNNLPPRFIRDLPAWFEANKW